MNENKNSLEDIYRRARESLKDKNLPPILVGGLPVKKENEKKES